MVWQTDTSSRIAGIVCALFAGGLVVGAACWLGVLLLLVKSRRIELASAQLPVAAGLFQIAVAILFALSGALLLRRSRRAKPLLITAIISMVVDLVLGFVAFVAFARLISSGD